MNVGFFIGFIIFVVLFLLLVAFTCSSNDIDDMSVGCGVGIAVLFILSFLFGACAFDKEEIYYDKYHIKAENVKEYRVDTTFTTTNGVTDTTYTIFYNKAKKENN